MRNSRLVSRAVALQLVACSAVVLLAAQVVQAAPSAKITAVTLRVYHHAGPDGRAQWSKVGDLLPPGSQVSTMKRSACQITFPDGSRVRMGARCDMIINDVVSKKLHVVTGEVFANIVSGTGAQIQGATATASIKGTWVLFQAPTAPGVEPVRTTDSCSVWGGQAEFSTPLGSVTLGDGQASSAGPGRGPEAATPGFSYGFGDGSFTPSYSNVTPGTSTAATPGTGVGAEVKNVHTTARSEVVAVVESGPLTGTVPVTVQSAQPSAVGPAPSGGFSLPLGPLALAAAGAVGDEEGERGRLGRKFFGINSELDVIGLLYNGGSLGGVRPRASAISGHWYGEVGAQSFRDSEDGTTTTLSDLFVVDRLGNTDITLGRQRYLEGPVNNSGLGSLFANVHFDGASYKHKADEFTLKLSWLERFDASSRTPTSTHGWLGRVSVPFLGGQVALNALQQGGNGWGFSGDLSLPAIPRELDLYAELGSDPLGRHLETFGAYFPGLYQSADIDLFIERAQRAASPAVWSATAYADLSKGWTGIAGARKVQGGDTECLIGFVKSFGSLSY